MEIGCGVASRSYGRREFDVAVGRRAVPETMGGRCVPRLEHIRELFDIKLVSGFTTATPDSVTQRTVALESLQGGSKLDRIAGWEFYLVYSLFRIAAILQGIAKRAIDGTAASPEAAAMGRLARPLGEQAWALAESL